MPNDHGSSEKFAWGNMHSRCGNPNNSGWKDYGGRGIRVCDRWSKFKSFLEDMGRKPGPLHSLDRINNDGDYEPSNCRWATRAEQRLNCRRPTVSRNAHTSHVGLSLERGKWRARIRINKKLVSLGSYDTEDEASTAYQRKKAEIMNHVTQQAAQGDVFFIRVAAIPDGYAPVAPDCKGRYVAAHSETGHDHVIDASGVIYYEGRDPLVAYLRLESVDHADVIHLRSHDTHATVRLSGGAGAIYEVRKQREFDPAGERRAAD